MYLSIKLKTIKKVVKYFNKIFNSKTKKNQTFLGAHPLWDELKPDLLW